MRLAPDLSFARELQPQNIELTGFRGVAVIGTTVVECPVTNVAAYRDGTSIDSVQPKTSVVEAGSTAAADMPFSRVAVPLAAVDSRADGTRFEVQDAASLVLLGSRPAATPRTHSRQTSKSSLTLQDASRSPSKCAT